MNTQELYASLLEQTALASRTCGERDEARRQAEDLRRERDVLISERNEARDHSMRVAHALEDATKKLEDILNPNGRAQFSAQLFADAFGQLLDATPEARNYFTFNFKAADTDGKVGDRITVCVKRYGGKAPEDLVAELTKELEAFKAAVSPIHLEIAAEAANQKRSNLSPFDVLDLAPNIQNCAFSTGRIRLIETAAACINAIEKEGL